MGKSPDPKDYPSLDLAYEFVRPSYDLHERRLRAVEGRAQMIIGFAATVALAAPILAGVLLDKVDFTSWWFAAAILAFTASMIVGLLTITLGKITFVDPGGLTDSWQKRTPDRFKRDMLDATGHHYDHNQRLIDRKGHFATGLIIGFSAEVALLLVWVIIQV